MGDEKKKKKKKKEVKKEKTPEPVVKETKKVRKKEKAKKLTTTKYSGALSVFTEKQLREFKDGFNYMDQDKDGIITKPDLFRCYDLLGVSADDGELADMLGEAPNPITFTQMLTLFAERMQGKIDDDDLIRDSFKAFDEGDGSIDPVTFENIMKGKGDKLTKDEVNTIFPELPTVNPEGGNFSIPGIFDLLIPKKEGQEDEAPAPPAPAPAAPAPAPATEVPAAEEEAGW